MSHLVGLFSCDAAAALTSGERTHTTYWVMTHDTLGDDSGGATMTACERMSAAEELERAARDLEESTPQEILAWALDEYRPRITLACSFGGSSGMALLDMTMRLDSSVPVFYLDTGLLFTETYALIDEVSRHYGITPRPVRPALSVAQQNALHGEALWARDPDRCCAL